MVENGGGRLGFLERLTGRSPGFELTGDWG